MRRLLIVLLALASAGCTLEMRGSEMWACDTVQTSVGPVYGCQRVF